LSENFATVDRDEIDLNVDIPSLFTVPPPNGQEYLRYRYTASGVSPRALPGQVGLNYVSGSDEHDEKGHLISDIKSGIPLWVAERVKMMDKRMRKLKGLAAESEGPVREGPESAPLTFVAWGSTVGAIRDAMKILAEQNQPTNLVHLPTVYPIHGEALGALLAPASRTLLVEANFSGQLGRLIRAETGIHFPRSFLKYDGEPFYPMEIVERAREELHVR
ncbi:MAG: 2-oxoacid:acceptor oxidoreductase subunit alpha, partial [Thermoplasmata archaeon]